MRKRLYIAVFLVSGTMALMVGLAAWAVSTRTAHYDQTTERLDLVLAQSNQSISLILQEIDNHLVAMSSAFSEATLPDAYRLQGWLSHQSFGGGAFLMNTDGRCHPDNRAAAADCHALANRFDGWQERDGLIWADPVETGDRWIAGIARRVVDREGTVLALAGYSIDTDLIMESWRRLGLPDDSAVILIRPDTQTLWLRHPFDPALQGRDLSGGPLVQAVMGTTDASGHVEIDPINTDGIRRRVAWTQLYHGDLVLAAGLSRDSIMADWQVSYLPGLLTAGASGFAALLLVTGSTVLLTRSQSQRDLAEGRLNRFFALTSDLHAVADPDGRLLEINDAWTRLLGWPRESLIGRVFLDLLVDEDRARTAEYLEDHRKGIGAVGNRNRYRTADGGYRWLEWNAQVDEAGLIHASGRDVTEEIARSEALTVAMDEAVAANQAKSAFLANMSHELRTPLNAILGFTEIMRHRLFGPLGGTPEAETRYCGYVDDIHDAGTVLLATISDILDLSKIERGGLVLDVEPVDLGDQIDETLRLLAFEAGSRDLVLTADRPDDPVLAMADEKAVGQILRNLVSNALKFTEAGGAVTIRLNRIAIPGVGAEKGTRLPAGDYARLSVVDTGIGIPPESLAEVLQPFRQVQNHLTRDQSGSGLGLAIASGLAEAMGGTLDLESTVGMGTTATVTLPSAA